MKDFFKIHNNIYLQVVKTVIIIEFVQLQRF